MHLEPSMKQHLMSASLLVLALPTDTMFCLNLDVTPKQLQAAFLVLLQNLCKQHHFTTAPKLPLTVAGQHTLCTALNASMHRMMQLPVSQCSCMLHTVVPWTGCSTLGR